MFTFQIFLTRTPTQKKFRLPILSGATVFISPDEISQRLHARLANVARSLGATVPDALSDACTHYISHIVRSERYDEAVRVGAIPVTSKVCAGL